MPAPSWTTRLRDNLLARTIIYYVVLVGIALAAWTRLERWLAFAPATDLVAGRGRRSAFLSLSDSSVAAMRVGDAAISTAEATAIAMIVAALLALPVAWLYILTRHKKGYRQSVVQTLVLLPIVVAGVVVLVKNSLALAFSLAGIVAAVRFRNTLEDSKDAVYIFLVTALGLAAGVQPAVAVVLSVAFNVTMLVLWATDFGRTPAPLEGTRADRQLERAMQIVNRTGMFVARIDDEVLKGMSPDQLDALADRAWRRRKRNAPELADDAEANGDRPPYDVLLRVRTRDVDATRAAVEPVMAEVAKRWRLGGVVHEDAETHVLEYDCALKKSATPGSVRERIAAAVGDGALEVEVH